MPQGLWDLNFSTRNGTHASHSGCAESTTESPAKSLPLTFIPTRLGASKYIHCCISSILHTFWHILNWVYRSFDGWSISFTSSNYSLKSIWKDQNLAFYFMHYIQKINWKHFLHTRDTNDHLQTINQLRRNAIITFNLENQICRGKLTQYDIN